MSPILIVAGSIALFGGLIWWAIQQEKKRTAAMETACRAMGYAFEERADIDQLRALADLPVFGHGHSKRAGNVMTGRLADRDVKVLDYKYTTGSGKNSHTHHQTLVLFPGADPGLPDLALAPEQFFHKIGSFFGYQDIDFPENPEFSDKYLLRGGDEAAIRRVFTAEVLAFFAHNVGWHVEVRSGSVGIYRTRRRQKPEEVPAYLAEALGVLRQLARG